MSKPILEREYIRPSLDEYFFSIARIISERSSCIRKKYGCVLVKNGRIIATGYNGSPFGCSNCDEVGCLKESRKECRGSTAELNVIANASLSGVSTQDSELYQYFLPGSLSSKILINAGVKKVHFKRSDFVDSLTKDLFKEANVEMIEHKRQI